MAIVTLVEDIIIHKVLYLMVVGKSILRTTMLMVIFKMAF